MVKIKDFTLASKNRGGGGRVPQSYTHPAHAHFQIFIFFSDSFFACRQN